MATRHPVSSLDGVVDAMRTALAQGKREAAVVDAVRETLTEQASKSGGK